MRTHRGRATRSPSQRRGRVDCFEVVERAAVLTDADGRAVIDPSAVSILVADRRRAADPAATLGAGPGRQDRKGTGGHGGGDALLLTDIFRGPGDDWLERPADWLDGIRAIAVGMAGNESLRTGLPIKITDLDLGVDFPAELGIIDVDSSARP